MAQINMNSMLGMTPEEMAIARKMKYAEALRTQATEPTEGQMVSGHYVPPSWTQQLAKLVSGYGAHQMDKNVDESQKAYGEKQKAAFTDTAQKYAQALRGTPADTMYDPELGQNIEAMPAQPGSREAALGVALQSQSPQWQQVGMQGMIDPTKGKTSDMQNWEYAQNLPEDQRAQFLGASKTVPSNIQEWTAFQKMSPQQQEQYLRMKRADQIMNLGGTQAVRGQMGGIREEYAVTPKPDEMPTFKAAQTVATESAKAGVQAEADKQKAVTEARASLPQVQDEATHALNVLDQMVGSQDGSIKPHPGFKDYVGTLTGEYVAKIPGTKAADFKSYYDQIGGTAFLQAFESLKGGGQITEVEGKKATQAKARMDRAQSPEEFEKGARELQSIIKQGMERAQNKAQFNPPSVQAAPMEADIIKRMRSQGKSDAEIAAELNRKQPAKVKRYNPQTGRIE